MRSVVARGRVKVFMVKFDDSGFRKLQQNLKKLEGKRTVPLPELMPDRFIRQHSQFQSLQAFLDAGGVESGEDISSPAFSSFVASNTRFRNWDEMAKAAGVEWSKKQLGF